MLIAIEGAIARITAAIVPLPSAPVAIGQARTRVLREPVRSDRDQPAFDRSAMDGFVVHREPGPGGSWRIGRAIHAGDPAGPALVPGEAARIFTGGAVPEAGHRIIPTENAEVTGDSLRDREPAAPDYIRRRGEDCRKGEVLLPSPVRIAAPELAILAQNGVTTPTVTRDLRLLHLTSGDELVDASAEPVGAQIRDTNSPLVRALVAETCGTAAALTQLRVGDRKEAFREAFREGQLEACDVLLVSGGAARGDRDLTLPMLQEAGFSLEFQGVDLRPGKPFGFATRGPQVAFILPGNPVSHWTVWHTLVAPGLRGLMGLPGTGARIRLPLACDWNPGSEPRVLRWPACLTASDAGWLVARPLELASSGDLSNLAGANALIRHRPDGKPLPAGTQVEVEQLL